MRSPATAVRRAALGPILVAVLAFGLAACSTSDETSSPDTTAGGSGTTTTAAAAPAGSPTGAGERPSCSAAVLGAAALPSFEAPELLDVVCQQRHATATLVNGPGGELLLLFEVRDGAWVLVGSGPVDDLAAVATPADFSTTAIPEWSRARQARLTRAAAGPSSRGVDPSAPPSSLATGPDGQQQICTEPDMDVRVCTPVTTSPPADPESPPDPNAPPVPESMFCRYNYLDPRCVADPGFEP